jgi:hypothetical protein
MLTGSFAGRWCLPDREADPRFGLLVVSDDELKLDLVGSFVELPNFGRLNTHPVVFGQTTDGKRWTLINAMVVNETLNTAALDVPATTLRPGGVICGAHLADPVGARWSIASFELDRLTAWTSPTGFSRSIELTPERHARSIAYRYDVPEDVVVDLPGGTLRIGPSQQTTGDLLHDAGLRVTVEAHVTLEEPATIDEISRRWLKPLLNLVTLATQKPTGLVRLRVGSDPAPTDDGSR